MSNPLFRLTISAVAVLSLPACAQMPDYSPHYVQVPVYSAERPHRIVSYQLVPEACLRPDPTDTQLGPRLPPGCANNANLLAMVERKSDVVKGWPPLHHRHAPRKSTFTERHRPSAAAAGPASSLRPRARCRARPCPLLLLFLRRAAETPMAAPLP
jgi:hypothetical protein